MRKEIAHVNTIFSREFSQSRASIVRSLVRNIGAGTTQVLISLESLDASSGVKFQVITALPVSIGSFTFGEVSISHPTNIAICFPTSLRVNSQNI